MTDHSLQHTADSGVVSSTADLNVFFRALAEGRLLPDEQWRQMRRTVPRTDDPEDIEEQPRGTYGLGLRESPLSCGGSYFTHEGDGLGVYTRPAVTADGRRAVTVSITRRPPGPIFRRSTRRPARSRPRAVWRPFQPRLTASPGVCGGGVLHQARRRWEVRSW
ncbi:hypothetical protein T261_0328 [Streptomyces lydicus]|nr:hypothetical protein T261_0328 [Streptomyces lydicus]